jgi:hypothetical protein
MHDEESEASMTTVSAETQQCRVAGTCSDGSESDKICRGRRMTCNGCRSVHQGPCDEEGWTLKAQINGPKRQSQPSGSGRGAFSACRSDQRNSMHRDGLRHWVDRQMQLGRPFWDRGSGRVLASPITSHTKVRGSCNAV